jgi:FkbM family methyltransferase
VGVELAAVVRILLMDLYRQDAEIDLLSRLIPHLESRSLIDVGAELGGVAEELLRAGAEEVHAFEPHPDNAATLRARFDGDAQVRVHEYALSDGDGTGELHLSSSPDGGRLSFGHTLIERPDTDEIQWKDTITVARRSLESLIQTGDIPRRTGIVKIDTEGHDLAVVRGMGALEADVVMVEHWTNLPHGLGPCPWTTQELVATLRPRGFTHFAFIVHRGEFVTLKWDDGAVEPGAMGNLVFLHDRVVTQVLPELLYFAGSLAEGAVRVGQEYMRSATDRMAVIDELKRAADARLALIHELQDVADARLDALEAANAERQAPRGASD